MNINIQLKQQTHSPMAQILFWEPLPGCLKRSRAFAVCVLFNLNKILFISLHIALHHILNPLGLTPTSRTGFEKKKKINPKRPSSCWRCKKIQAVTFILSDGPSICLAIGWHGHAWYKISRRWRRGSGGAWTSTCSLQERWPTWRQRVGGQSIRPSESPSALLWPQGAKIGRKKKEIVAVSFHGGEELREREREVHLSAINFNDTVAELLGLRVNKYINLKKSNL